VHRPLVAIVALTRLTDCTLRGHRLATAIDRNGQIREKRVLQREREKFIIRQPPIGEKDDYDSENSWISDGLPSSSGMRRTGDGRGGEREWREK